MRDPLRNIVILQSGRGDMDVAELMRFSVIISEVIAWYIVCIFFFKPLITIIALRIFLFFIFFANQFCIFTKVFLMILPWDDATFDMYFSDDRKVVTCMMQWWMNHCVLGCNRGFVIKCIDFFSDWLHSLLGSIRLNVRSSQYETSLLTLAIEPHSAYPAGSVLSALAQMRVKRMGRGPCCSPCQRFRPCTERWQLRHTAMTHLHKSKSQRQ